MDGLGEGRGVGSAGNWIFGAGLGLGMLRSDSCETRRTGICAGGMGKERTRGVARWTLESSSSENERSSVLKDRRVNMSVSRVFMPEVVKDSARSRDKNE